MLGWYRSIKRAHCSARPDRARSTRPDGSSRSGRRLAHVARRHAHRRRELIPPSTFRRGHRSWDVHTIVRSTDSFGPDRTRHSEDNSARQSVTLPTPQERRATQHRPCASRAVAREQDSHAGARLSSTPARGRDRFSCHRSRVRTVLDPMSRVRGPYGRTSSAITSMIQELVRSHGTTRCGRDVRHQRIPCHRGRSHRQVPRLRLAGNRARRGPLTARDLGGLYHLGALRVRAASRAPRGGGCGALDSGRSAIGGLRRHSSGAGGRLWRGLVSARRRAARFTSRTGRGR